jgi:hypothetical protein
MVKHLASGSVPSSPVGGMQIRILSALVADRVLICLWSFYKSALALSDRFLEMDLISRKLVLPAAHGS